MSLVFKGRNDQETQTQNLINVLKKLAKTTSSQPQAEFTGVEGHMMTTDLTKQQLKLTGDLNAVTHQL